ncbi:MAG TPA: hypothetical protein VE464_24440, partial [Streptosporangiaceae bacterium]|nr:hypothetical protein [Streptosporangiaceae bacterium]
MTTTTSDGLLAGAPGPPAARTERAVPASVTANQDADDAVVALYAAHYQPLVRYAALLLRDASTAEEVVQDS